MPILTPRPAYPTKKKTYPTDSCIQCYKKPGEAHYAGACVWHIPSERFSENYISYTVKLGGPLAECDCTHGEYRKAAGKGAECKHVRYAAFKEAQRTTPQGELFEEEEEEETPQTAPAGPTLESIFG